MDKSKRFTAEVEGDSRAQCHEAALEQARQWFGEQAMLEIVSEDVRKAEPVDFDNSAHTYDATVVVGLLFDPNDKPPWDTSESADVD